MVAPARVLARVDGLLFSSAEPVLLIDRDNRNAGHVADLAAARVAVERGRAATYAAQLHPDVVGLDIDVDDPRLSAYLVEELTGWADRRGLWHLGRASGGGPGRRHLFIAATGDNADQLIELVRLLRSERRLNSRQLDIRTVIRPLSAPHRVAGPVAMQEILDAHASDLAAVLPSQRPSRRPSRSRTVRSNAREPELVLLPDRMRTLMASIILTGNRSDDEFALTRALYNDGYDQAAAWSSVRSLNGHGAARGFAWWNRYIWSRMEPLSVRRQSQGIDASVLILPVFAVIRSSYTTMETRQRHTLETVGWALLERLTAALDDAGQGEQRTTTVGTDEDGEADVGWRHMSQRDLELATGRSRNAIRGALVWLEKNHVVERQLTARADHASRWRLGSAARQALMNPPLLTPPPRLGLPAISTWAPQSAAGTASAALNHQLATPCPAPPIRSTRQQQLLTLASADATHAGLCQSPRTRPPESAGWHARLARITQERDRYGTVLREHRSRRYEDWRRQRATALAAERRRHLSWWRALSPEQRAVWREHRRLAKPASSRQQRPMLRGRQHTLTTSAPGLSGAKGSRPGPPSVAERDSGVTCLPPPASLTL